MNFKTKRRIAFSLIGLLIILFLFSLLAIFNLASLYKDQVEMPAIDFNKNISREYLWELLKTAKELTNWINFFEYTALTSVFAIFMLISKTAKSKSKNIDKL